MYETANIELVLTRAFDAPRSLAFKATRLERHA